MIEVNLNGIFFVAQQAARRMIAGDGDVILNMGSTNWIVDYPFYADCNASKAGVIELTRSIALELAPKVRVNASAQATFLHPTKSRKPSRNAARF